MVASRHSTKVPQNDQQQARCMARLVQQRAQRRTFPVATRQRNIHGSRVPNFEAAPHASLLVDLFIGVCQELSPLCLGVLYPTQCLSNIRTKRFSAGPDSDMGRRAWLAAPAPHELGKSHRSQLAEVRAARTDPTAVEQRAAGGVELGLRCVVLLEDGLLAD